MSDTSYPVFQHYGTHAQRLAFTPAPPSGGQPIYIWYETDTGAAFLYDTSWHQITSAGSLPSSVQGDTFYSSAVNTVATLAKDTNATRYLSNQGTSNNPSWNQVNAANGITGVLPGVNGGGLVRIGPPVVTAGSQATVDFTSIPGTYNGLVLFWDAQDTTAGTNGSSITMKVNNDGTSGNYTAAARYGSIGNAAIVSASSATGTGVQVGFIPNAGNTNITGSGRIEIINYANSSFHKRIRYEFAEDDGTNGGFALSGGWRWMNTAPVTRLTITAGTAFANGGLFVLCGMN